MSLREIELELNRLPPEDLRRLAMKSWSAYVARESSAGATPCDEDDPALLAALDEAVAHADATSGVGMTGNQLRARLVGRCCRGASVVSKKHPRSSAF